MEMTYCKHAAGVLLALCLLGLSGCGGGTPADQAAQEMLDFAAEAEGLGESGDPAKAMELVMKAMQSTTKLVTELKKLSPDELKAFDERWGEKFKAADMGLPSEMVQAMGAFGGAMGEGKSPFDEMDMDMDMDEDSPDDEGLPSDDEDDPQP
ncbi:MAG: hypothetical protein ACYTG0_30440 [Planctomycetota bacterium]|jgi:hypothetical protein